MNGAERIRTAICYGLLAGVLVLLAGRLAYLQLLGKGSLLTVDGRSVALDRDAADNQRWRSDSLPAPRGTIVDRWEKVLAVDLPVMEVRAEVTLWSGERRNPARLRSVEQTLVRELAHVLALDPAQADDPKRRNERPPSSSFTSSAWGPQVV